MIYIETISDLLIASFTLLIFHFLLLLLLLMMMTTIGTMSYDTLWTRQRAQKYRKVSKESRYQINIYKRFQPSDFLFRSSSCSSCSRDTPTEQLQCLGRLFRRVLRRSAPVTCVSVACASTHSLDLIRSME